LIKTAFAKEYLIEKLLSYVDTINLLYVSCTRAKEELHLFSSAKSKDLKSDIKDMGNLMFRAVFTKSDESEADERVFSDLTEFFDHEKMTLTVKEGHDRKRSTHKGSESDVAYATYPCMIEYPTDHFEKKIRIKFSSAEFIKESIEQIEAKVNYGILMHKIFSEIHTADDIESALDNFIIKGYISTEEKKELNEQIRQILNRPHIREWFSGMYEVRNEEALMTEKGDIKIPDRVMIGKDKIIIVDFKFGKQRSEYRSQISDYKKIVAEVYGLHTESYIYYAEDDESVPV
jgi:ATP-dependent exoDNAse (exonuclease V) beta subunit